MRKILDYKCPDDDKTNLSLELKKESGLTFPEAYKYAQDMVKLSLFLKEKSGSNLCSLSFCHTVEGEALGANINFEGDNVGPRAKDYIVTDLEEILSLSDINFNEGRIFQTLKAIEILKDKGEFVVLDICGPLTILNTIIDSKKVFIALRKNPELIRRVFDKLQNNIIKYFEEAISRDVDLISYADPVSGVIILGPKIAEEYINSFVYPFFKAVKELDWKNTAIHLCPKTTLQLIGCEKAEYKEYDFDEKKAYYDGLKIFNEDKHFWGERCINLIEKKEKKTLRKIVLK